MKGFAAGMLFTILVAGGYFEFFAADFSCGAIFPGHSACLVVFK